MYGSTIYGNVVKNRTWRYVEAWNLPQCPNRSVIVKQSSCTGVSLHCGWTNDVDSTIFIIAQ